MPFWTDFELSVKQKLRTGSCAGPKKNLAMLAAEEKSREVFYVLYR